MNDDELRAQLERRSQSAQFRAADLLPGINRAIGVPVRAKPARFARWAPLAGLAAAAALVLVLVVVIPRSPIGGNAATASPGSSGGLTTASPDVVASSPSVATANSGDFTLTLISDKHSYRPDEPINVHAELLYTGAEPSVTLVGSGSGLVTFPIKQLDGNFETLPVMSADCAPYILQRGVPLSIPFSKSFGTSAEDPNHDLLMTFAADPALHLWPGQWRITGAADFYVGECAKSQRLFDTSIQFDVISEDGPLPSTRPTVAVPSPSPSTSASANRFECAAPPLPPYATLSPGPAPIVIDETGLITSCSQTDALTELVGSISVSNPFGPEGLEVMWAHGPCDAGIVFTFLPAGNGYELVGERPTEACEPGTGLPLYLTFSTAMPAETVEASLASAAPTPPPTSIPESAITCADTITLVDATSLVMACSDAGEVDYHSQDAKTSNPDGDLTRLHLWWGTDSCTLTRRIEFGRDANGYVARVFETTLHGCFQMPDAHAIDIELARPTDATTVRVERVFPPEVVTPPATTVECAPLGSETEHITLSDQTGLVSSCEAVAGDLQSDRDIEHPDGDPRQLLVRWSDGPCAGNPGVAFAALPDRYLLRLSAPTCQLTSRAAFALLIHLTSDVGDDITYSYAHGNPGPSEIDLDGWHIECAAVSESDCRGIFKLFLGNLAWSYGAVSAASDHTITVAPRPTCPERPEWALGDECWQASTLTPKRSDPPFDDGRACMIVTRNPEGFGQVGGDYFMDSTIWPEWEQCT